MSIQTVIEEMRNAAETDEVNDWADELEAMTKEPVKPECHHTITEGIKDDAGWFLRPGRYALYPSKLKLFAAPPSPELEARATRKYYDKIEGISSVGPDDETPLGIPWAAYIEIWRDIVYTAADFGAEADDEIAELEAQAAAMRERLRKAEKLEASRWPVLNGWMQRAQNAEQENDRLRAELEQCKEEEHS